MYDRIVRNPDRVMKVAGNLFSRRSDDCRSDVVVHEQFNTMAIWDCKCINHILFSTISSINEFFKKTIRVPTYGSNYSAVAFALLSSHLNRQI